MTAHNCDQDYFNPAGVPGWGAKDTSKTGWLPWLPGGGGGPTVTLYFMNKVWDPGPLIDGPPAPLWVMWETEDAPDPTGAFYPDPYGRGFGACTFFRVQGMRYA
jgi:hypothetical protein